MELQQIVQRVALLVVLQGTANDEVTQNVVDYDGVLTASLFEVRILSVVAI